jgi:hypothetical protein
MMLSRPDSDKRLEDRMPSSAVSPAPLIESRIYVIRGQKVLIDADLAVLYQVLTKNLNLAVRRNRSRFPEDFMFQLTAEEAQSLRLQIATSNSRGGRRYAPYVFTEQGIAMLSSVLSSERAIQVNIAIMRAFVRLRQLLATNEELALRLDELERQQLDQNAKFDQHDSQIERVFSTIDQLITPPLDANRRRIGFPTSQGGVIASS